LTGKVGEVKVLRRKVLGGVQRPCKATVIRAWRK
jgi:hypothetical protein